ncbi:hypothetical protein ACFWJS_33720 [Streptomyces sp. NPDC127061]|uniref:hypothetical protein n=1 Tax=Streptomyces sp. NPDC127061 TaxID=3347122 RepID=UPI003646CAED
MQRTSSTIHTADGQSVTIRRAPGNRFDLETKNEAGETISTVVMSAACFAVLRAEMDEVAA